MHHSLKAETESEHSTVVDSNTVVMRGVLSFKQFFPEWKGHWNYIIKDNRETVNRSQTISYKRSNRVWPFIPEDEKQNFDIYTDSNRKGLKQAYPEYQQYLSTHLKKYACEFCGLWEGMFYIENSRIPIKESFRLSIAYCGSVGEFDPKNIPIDSLNFSDYASHLLDVDPISGIIILNGVGENEFGLFKALVSINPDRGTMTTIKCYFHDQITSASGFLVGTTGRTKGESLETIKKRLLDPNNRKRQTVKSEVVVDICDVCNSPSEKSSTSNTNHNSQLITCTKCGIHVHPICYGIDITNATMSINTRFWVCDPCLYNAWNNQSPWKHSLCVCCHYPGGALKRSLEGEWCHLSCMLYSNHLSVLSYNNMEPIIAKTSCGEGAALSTLSHDLFLHTCCICQQPGGITEKCCVNGCNNYMHGRCLRYYKSTTHNQVKSYSVYVFRDDEGYRNVKYYCPLHGVSKDTVEERSEGTICNGIFTIGYPNNEVYKGEIHNDKREGYGEYFFNNGIVYRGEWYNDKEHGKGEYHRGDDIIYKGDFADGRINGYGVYYYDNGDVYDGYFREGLRCNNGIYLFHNGSIYDGEWKDDRRHGVGTLIDTKGNQYTGEWKNDYREGKGDLECKQKRTRLVDRDTGEETFPKQQRLISHMSDRIKEAEEGIEKRLQEAERRIEEETVEEKVKYSGQFKLGLFEGAGSLYYGTGDSYKGMFHGNLRDGRGTYHFKNYSLYEGHFREDRIEGVGTVTIAKNVKAKRDEIFIPIILPQGSIKEVHKSAGFEENGL